MTNPWLDPLVARQQRALADQQLQNWQQLPHFNALVAAVKSTQCPGQLLVVGCGVGQERELLDRAGVEYRSFAGIDISPESIRLARERYPESSWYCEKFDPGIVASADVVVDSACVMHVDAWREHLAALCKASRRWIILHRVPLAAGMPLRTGAWQKPTSGYGHEFPAWEFGANDLYAEMESHGFELQGPHTAYGGQATLVFAKARHYASYCDAAYLPRLKALHASMVRHCGPFRMHVLAWDDVVSAWCESAGVDFARVDRFLLDHPDLELERLPGLKRTRTEHMFTLGPAYVVDVMKRTSEPAAYIDADLYAFSSAESFFAEAGGAAAAFVGHNFAPESRGTPGPTVETHAIPFGALNVGIALFNDSRVAQRWADLVRGWCYNRCEVVDGRLQFADQKRLEQLCDEFPGCVVIENEAAMVGPWNINARSLWAVDGVPHFGGRPVGFYHFSSLQLGPHGQWSPSRPEYQVSQRAIDLLYGEYLSTLEKAK